MAFRVEVDRGLCQGHGVCESEAPAVFAVSKKGELSVLDDTPPDDQRPAVELAVKYCPTHALKIVDFDREGEEAR
ncbi:MAG: ferredoxin [Acidimicrobiales bacterium]